MRPSAKLYPMNNQVLDDLNRINASSIHFLLALKSMKSLDVRISGLRKDGTAALTADMHPNNLKQGITLGLNLSTRLKRYKELLLHLNQKD